MEEHETYLGDSVCASFDGHMIWLRTTNGNNQRITLEPFVFENLVEYVTWVEAPRPPGGGFEK